MEKTVTTLEKKQKQKTPKLKRKVSFLLFGDISGSTQGLLWLCPQKSLQGDSRQFIGHWASNPS